MAGANANFDGLSRLYGVDAALSEDGAVKEGVAGPIGKFDEPEAFVGVEPLDDPVDQGTGRVFERLAEPRSGAESTGLWMVGVYFEVATPRMTKILLSQTLVPGGFVPDQSGRATHGRAVADLMGSWFQYYPKAIGKHH